MSDSVKLLKAGVHSSLALEGQVWKLNGGLELGTERIQAVNNDARRSETANLLPLT